MTESLSQPLFTPVDSGLPRELLPGVFWLGECIQYPYKGSFVHGNNSAFLVTGSHSSLLVDTGLPGRFSLLEEQLEQIIGGGRAPLRYMFGTHWEPPHGGGTAMVLERFPDARYCGDTTDFELMYPGFADRVTPLEIGEHIDLGGREFVAHPAVFCDGRSTRWGFDTATRTLFSADGLAYGHMHAAGQCARTAEEVGEDLDVPRMTAQFADAAFYWTRFVDPSPFIDDLDRFVRELGVELICPAHGLPVSQPLTTLPRVHEGIRLGARGGVDEDATAR
jgi:flavorubredoxin